MHDFEIKFWKDWLYAYALERVNMVEKLPVVRDMDKFGKLKLPQKMKKQIFARMLNSYFEDLESAAYIKQGLAKKSRKNET